MKFRNFLTSIATVAILAGIASAQIGIPGQPAITFDKAKFEAHMLDSLDGQVMGYQYVLIKKGQVVSEDARGRARTTANGGNVDMTLNTPTNIGSLAKFMSGTAMLGLMQKPQYLNQYDHNLSLDQKLDRPIWTVMPNAWTNNMKSGVENITFRQMLSHRTGFDKDKVGNRTVLGYMKDANGFLLGQYDQWEYANINFVLNGYLLYLYADPNTKNAFNIEQNAYNLTDAESDQSIRQLAGTQMHSMMKKRIWDKMTPKIYPNCDAANTLQNVAAYGYDSVSDAGAGQITSAIDTQGHCGGHGGYYLSARALANYIAHFAHTDLIVTQEARDLMNGSNLAWQDRLVWGDNQSSAYFGDNFNMPNIAWSNGVTGGWRAIIVRFPMDYYLVVTTNSPDYSAEGLRGIGMQAFREATEHNFQ